MSQYSSSNNYSAAYASYPPSNVQPPTNYSRHTAPPSSHASSSRYHPYERPSSHSGHSSHSSSHYPVPPPPSRYGSSHHSGSSSSYRPNSRFDRGGPSGGGSDGYKPKKQKAPRNEFGIPYGQPGAGLSAPDWSRMQLADFKKNFYREATAISNMKEEDVLAWRKKRDIVVFGTNIPRPIRTFAEAGFPSYIMAEIERAGFEKPTSIQAQGWPMAMSGRDVIGIAETGSGKTLAFLLPCIVHINAQPLLRHGDGPIVLVIAPTRELAIQIENECSKFAYSSKIKHCCVYGGVSRREQIRNLKNGVEIIICTPGRMLDFLESSVTNLRRVTYLVIDEADRLLDMGFEPQLSSMLSQVRPDRQMLMWSATWPKEVQSLSRKYLGNDTIQVSVASALQSGAKANPNVKQSFEFPVTTYEKQDMLYKILRNPDYDNRKLLIFSSTKKQCDYLYQIMKSDRYKVTVIHGDKQQNERDEALHSFKTGRTNIMIATDVASRGIHIDDIYMVINYDMPQNIEDYVHRIGRTGRCGKKGVAISFFAESDAKRANKLVEILKNAKQEVPQKMLQYGANASSMGSYGRRAMPRYSQYSR